MHIYFFKFVFINVFIADYFKLLQLKADPWCSVGSLSAEGNLIGSGGYYQGRRAVRILEPCTNCDFYEKSDLLGSDRWYLHANIYYQEN